ncbi:MAG: RNA polymerase sigma factor RpoH [Gammaproteobacteria bacterium]|nr:RNA polymerase sigma factor RpoH [Gammaproteobacteria bacterium]
MATSLALQDRSLLPLSPVGSLDAYMTAVSSIPVLSREEEVRLARQFRDQDDLDAARQLVISNLRFVVHIARGYGGYGLQLGDIVQEGNIGLMKAVKRFDPEYGVRLVSFAVHWIRAEIHEFVLRNWRIVKIATTKAQRKLFFNLRKAKRHLGWLNPEETAAVANDLGVPEREVTEMESRLAARDLGFDGPDNDDDDGASYSPAVYLPTAEPGPQDLIAEDEHREQMHAQLLAAMEQLDDRSRDIVSSRWISEDKSTLQQLADKYGISAERIRQIESAALRKLRQQIVL